MYIYHYCDQYHHGCHSHRYCYYFYNIIFYRYFRSMFIESNIEPLTMALSEISSSLDCFGFLNAMKAKSDAFYHVFCPENIFSWDYDSLVQRFPPNYSEDGTNDKLKEVHIYRIFVDFAENSFMDGKMILKGFLYLWNY